MAGPPALIFGSGVTALGVVRGFAGLRIPAYVLPEPGEYVRHSRFYRPMPAVRGVDPAADLASFLERTPFARGVLVPCSDSWVMRIAELDPRTRKRFPACVPSPSVLRVLVDKAPFAKLLAEAGLPHPRTWHLAAPQDLERVPEGVFQSAFLKPHDSQSFFARFGVKAFRVASRDDAGRRMEALAAAGIRVLLQEYVPGPSSNHYFVDGFADRDASIRALLARRRLRMYPPDFGNSSCVVTIPLDDVQQAISTVTGIVQRLGYRGVFSAEFKYDERDGEFKILEVNARPWWYIGFAIRCGVDVCEFLYRDALGFPLPDAPSYDVGRRLVYPYYDFHACRARYRDGDMSLRDWVESWAGSIQPVFAWDDPWPAVRDTGQRLLGRLRRGVTRG